MTEIILLAIVGPIVVGTIMDLILRPKVEAKKTQLMFLEDLRRDTITLFGILTAGMTYVKKYDRFQATDKAIPTHISRLTRRLDEDAENAQRLINAIGKLKSHYDFSDDTFEDVVSKLTTVCGNLLRIRDTVAGKSSNKFKLFNGANKKVLEDDLDTLSKVRATIYEVAHLSEVEVSKH